MEARSKILSILLGLLLMAAFIALWIINTWNYEGDPDKEPEPVGQVEVFEAYCPAE